MAIINCLCINTLSHTPLPISLSLSTSFLPSLFPTITHCRTSTSTIPISINKAKSVNSSNTIIQCGLHLWPPSIDSQLFSLSLLPYLGFLYFLSKVKSTPKLTLFGFQFLLVFVAATVPAGIYEKVNYGTSLSNVDWLHGGAESLLALSNLFVVLGLSKALRESGD